MNMLVQNKSSSPSLGELLFSPENMDVTSEAEDFAVRSIEMAAWAARKVVDARARISARTELADRYKNRIDEWLKKSCSEDSESIEFFMSHLKPFAEREIGCQRRSRTVHLPGASLSLRKKPDRFEILDEAEAIAYCEESLPEVIVIKKQISKTALKQCLHKGLPPSIAFVPGEDELHISADTAQSVSNDRHAA